MQGGGGKTHELYFWHKLNYMGKNKRTPHKIYDVMGFLSSTFLSYEVTCIHTTKHDRNF